MTKELEKIDKQDSVVGIIEEKPLDVVSKKLKAFEIIKEKELDIWKFKCHKSLTEYNQNVSPLKWLTQEEFDLLKEVLF